jgi:hypothetical protein
MRTGAFSGSVASSFETHGFAMLLRMRSLTLMVRSAKRVSNHETRYAATFGPNWNML